MRTALRVPGFEDIGYGSEPDGDDLFALRSNALFRGVPPQVLPAVLAGFRVATLPAQTRLFVRGRSARRVFLIVAGEVAVVQFTGDVRTTIALLGPGEFTGERAVLRPPVEHVWSAICTTETRIGFIDAAALLGTARTLPAVGMNVARALHRRVVDAAGAIDALIAGP